MGGISILPCDRLVFDKSGLKMAVSAALKPRQRPDRFWARAMNAKLTECATAAQVLDTVLDSETTPLLDHVHLTTALHHASKLMVFGSERDARIEKVFDLLRERLPYTLNQSIYLRDFAHQKK